MAVHGALLSLAYTLDILIHNDDAPAIPLIDGDEGQQIKHLHESISFLQSFLEETSVDPSLERRIIDAAYHAEDVIQSHISDHIIVPPSGSNPTFQIQSTDARVDKSVKHNFDNVIEEIELIVKEAKTMMAIKKGSVSVEYDVRPDAGYSFGGSTRLHPPKMAGLSEDELLKIKNWLCGESSRLRVISVVGMGGTGKTTLARNFFDDALVAHHFHKRAWSTISQQYRKRNILQEILYSLTEKSPTEKCPEEELSQQSDGMLEEKVYKSLKGRRYLIVMDDMWSTKAWDDFRRMFPDDCNGSRIIFTTRLRDVAAYVDDSLEHVHHMKFLDGDQSWDLLREKVFARESCPQELEVIGKKIAEKCGGLPLAIVLIAGLLSNGIRKPREWEKFEEHVRSKLMADDDDDSFSKIMSLSYNHLPHHLKPCYLYVGGFPEDYEISVFKLLQLWIAEGFVTRPSNGRSLEEVAEVYLDDLVSRNLVLITKKSSTGNAKKFKMHDMLREFCIQKAKDDNFFSIIHSVEGTPNMHRRLFLSHQDRPRLRTKKATDGLNVRSVVISASSVGKADLSSFAASSTLLKVFEGLETRLSSHALTILVTKLLHLRYICFTCSTSLRRNALPASISRLTNLHTIIVRIFTNWRTLVSKEPDLIHLPSEIWRMPQLRHLIFYYCCFLSSPCARDNEKRPCLQNLQTLSRVTDVFFTQDMIALIPNLKKLGILYISENSHHNLAQLHQLESLNLTFWVRYCKDFVFPSTLRKLVLNRGRFPWEKMTVIGSLPNLQVLKLRSDAFIGKEWVTNDGEFPNLKFLLIGVSDLKLWLTESSHFPRLERLILHGCFKLEEIPSAIGEIPTLKLIEIDYGISKSAALSAKRIQKEQLDVGNDSLQVSIL